jgi:hypothetical protein
MSDDLWPRAPCCGKTPKDFAGMAGVVWIVAGGVKVTSDILLIAFEMFSRFFSVSAHLQGGNRQKMKQIFGPILVPFLEPIIGPILEPLKSPFFRVELNLEPLKSLDHSAIGALSSRVLFLGYIVGLVS